MTKVAILWHMHQPYYEDLATGEHILPWVRLHALKDYYGMVALLRDFPNVKVTFNLVPSLLVQLEAFASERARDRHLDLGMTPAAALTDEDRTFILANFFHAQRARMIEPYPRYAELLRMRRAGFQAFTDGDLLDLQVWHKLAWLDPFYLEGDSRVRALVEKGGHFSEDDKMALRAIELEILRRVIPEYRAAADRGQAELSTSPFYHPILPLLCDTDIYLREHPHSPMPRQPFRHPEDAAEQLARAVGYHERCFGRPPHGLWPSEGSVSDAVVSLALASGFHWMATDEVILARTLERPIGRDRNGRLEQPDLLYRPYRMRSGNAEIACLFRDHALSDLIGFTYAGWGADDAASDLVERLVEGGRRYAALTSGEEATIPIILDGENAWEHFDGGGRPFLRALYGRLAGHPELRTVTMAEAARAPGRTLTNIFPGSWINGDFYIWIGHADDRKAWSQLAEARAALETASSALDEPSRARAREEVLIAEGSDWCWWYGDDHSSEHDLAFDDLFRRHLRNAYQALQKPIPEELFMSNISTGPIRDEVVPPVGLVRPTLDGLVTNYFEWLSAGSLDIRETAGTMQASDRRVPLMKAIYFGFDSDHFHLRLDLDGAAGEALGRGLECSIRFTEPAGVAIWIRAEQGEPRALLLERPAGGSWTPRALQHVRIAASDIIEVSIPFADLAVRVGDRLAFFVSVHEGDAERERHPEHRPIQVAVPGADFEALIWTA